MIKKKRKPINPVIVPTKVAPRRKVIITKKRLLSNNIQIKRNNYTLADIDNQTAEIPPSTTIASVEEEEDDKEAEADIDNQTTEIPPSTTFASVEEEKDDKEAEEQETEIANNDDVEYRTNGEEDTNKDLEALDDDYPTTELDVSQNLPDYEPFFPELSESLDAPILLLKTTVLSSVDLETKTVLQSKLRTYTFLITRVNGDEQIVTSTTEVKPHTKTIVVTEPHTRYTTLTLLDLDQTETVPYIPQTVIPLADYSSQRNSDTGGESIYLL